MLHVRVVCPPAQTPLVLDALRAQPGATNLARFPGAALEPAGDLVQADIAREAVDGVLDRLRAVGVHETGTISIEAVDTALGAAADRAVDDAPGSAGDAVVWEQLTATTGDESQLTVSFLAFLIIATLIAAVGLLTDSQVLIVGAMVLGPEFGPLAGVAVGLVRGERDHVRVSIRALLVGFPIAIVATAAFVALLHAAGEVPAAYIHGRRPMTSFVASPDVFSVIVALLAGIAGTLSLTSAKASSLVGVFISVTTVPAAADIGAGAVTDQWSAAGGAAVQLVVNLVCIVAAAVLTLLVQESAWRRVAEAAGTLGPPVRRG